MWSLLKIKKDIHDQEDVPRIDKKVVRWDEIIFYDVTFAGNSKSLGNCSIFIQKEGKKFVPVWSFSGDCL